MPDSLAKRQRRNGWLEPDHGAIYDSSEGPSHLNYDDILADSALYALQDDFVDGLLQNREELNVLAERKRDHSNVDASDEGEEGEGEAQQWLRSQFPELYPAVPSFDNRHVTLGVPNPFAGDGAARHPKLRSAKAAVPGDGAISGLLKFRMRSFDGKSDGSTRPQPTRFFQGSMAVHHRSMPSIPTTEKIPALPPAFGLGRRLHLDATDSKLLKFYLVAFCSGRTLLAKSNGFYCDIAPMAADNDCVKHALLTLAATYVLDYLPSEPLRDRANWHYNKAVALLDEGLKSSETREIGKEDAIIGALVLLNCDDLVNWELHQARNTEPKWYKGARTAKQILDDSDPGYRYWKPGNVQSSNARIACGNKVASYDIFSQTVMPLSSAESKCSYSWLLEGTEREVRKVHGLTGLSSKLLHTFAQITHLATLMKETPDSVIVPIGAQKLRDRLANFWQWSELSEGPTSIESLLASCNLDSKGEVDCPARVTELIAETYVAAAQIYLECRLFRRPRKHPVVQLALQGLLACIERMPCSGPLFTAQAPLYTVFIGGVVASREEDRKIVRHWFEMVGSGTRGNVPPAWRGLRYLWDWMDEDIADEAEFEDETPIGARAAWWEDLVARLVTQEGRMNLA